MGGELGVVYRGSYIPFGQVLLDIDDVYTIAQRLYHQHFETCIDPYCDFDLKYLARSCSVSPQISPQWEPDTRVHESHLFLRYSPSVVALGQFRWTPMEDRRIYSIEIVTTI